jgi:FixJ family two-component response regulator
MSSRTQVLTKVSFHPAVSFPDTHAGRSSAAHCDHVLNQGVGPSSNLRVYLIEPDSGLRAKLARLVLASGFHVEIFASVAEFISYTPAEGAIFVNDSMDVRGVAGVIEMLANAQVLMPVVAYRDQPSISDVIAAMRARAANFLPIESFETGLREVLELAAREVELSRDRRSKVDDACKRIMCLTSRERQVLEMVVDGLSNKEVARILEISPRTVEIHRMKMMAKMSARSSSEAVRIWCSADMRNSNFS